MTSDLTSNSGTAPTIIKGDINADGLALVHSTAHKPVLNADGSVSLPSTYVATEGREARSTVHFALNHKVSGHLYGSWDEAAYAIISPFKAVVAAEGAPAMIMPSDTFWTTNARDPLKMPEATVVMPGGDDQKDLVKFNGNIVTYKTKGFTDTDEQLIAYTACDQQMLAETRGSDDREKFLKSRAMEFATEAALNHRGFSIERANQWHWIREDYNYRMADRLAETLGTKGSVPHMKTPYYGLSESMNFYLTMADYLEAKAGISSNKAEEEDGQCTVCKKDGAVIGSVPALSVRILMKERNLDERMQNLTDNAAELDPRTQDVVRDFTAKIRQRIDTALDAMGPGPAFASVAAPPKLEVPANPNGPTASMRLALDL